MENSSRKARVDTTPTVQVYYMAIWQKCKIVCDDNSSEEQSNLIAGTFRYPRNPGNAQSKARIRGCTVFKPRSWYNKVPLKIYKKDVVNFHTP